jgi:hypothetical protein
VKLRAALLEPAPVAMRLSAAGSSEQVVASLGKAIAERRYSVQDRNTPGLWRIDGAVNGRVVAITAKHYVIPGLPAGYGDLALSFDGRVEAGAEGTQLVGRLSAPLPGYLGTAMAYSLIGLIAVMTVAMGPIAILFYGPFAAVGAVLGISIARHNQRSSLKQHADEVGRFLGTIIESRDESGSRDPGG